jgi:hypothetical protein
LFDLWVNNILQQLEHQNYSTRQQVESQINSWGWLQAAPQLDNSVLTIACAVLIGLNQTIWG